MHWLNIALIHRRIDAADAAAASWSHEYINVWCGGSRRSTWLWPPPLNMLCFLGNWYLIFTMNLASLSLSMRTTWAVLHWARTTWQLDVRYHFFREKVEGGDIEVKFNLCNWGYACWYAYQIFGEWKVQEVVQYGHGFARVARGSVEQHCLI
jgi:hypothetical protein